MNFDWLISLSTALMTSVLGSGGEKVAPVVVPAKSREILQKKVDNSRTASVADLIKEFGGLSQGKFVPRKELAAKSREKLTKEVLTTELLAKVEEKLPADFQYPPIKEVIKFRDISEEDDIFETAKKLKSLEILPENNGFFGKPNEKNPEIKISEMKQILNRAFDKDGNLNYLTDKDLDGIPNALDACPDIPAKNGCPESAKDDKFPNDTVLEVNDDEVKMVDERQIMLGDKFAAIIFDPVSGEIYTQSEWLTVTK